MSEPSDLPEDHPINSPTVPFTGHEQFSVSYVSCQPPPGPPEPMSPAAHVLGRVFEFPTPPGTNRKASDQREDEARRSKKGSRRSLHKMKNGNDRRRSSIAQTGCGGNSSLVEQYSATSAASSCYTPTRSLLPTPQQANGSPNPNAPTTPNNNSLLSCLSPTATGVREAQNSPNAKNRRKAVITVNPQTTEILIANDNLRRLFELNHSSASIIGRKLTEIFPRHSEANGGGDRKVASFSLESDDDEANGGPTLHDELFTEDERLKPVYGKPVDIRDTHGELLTVCLWSYPLTPASSTMTTQQRKQSAMLMRSPSAFLPSTTANLTSTPLSIYSRVTTPSFAEANRKPLADPTGAHSQTPPSSSQSNGTPPSSQQQRNKSSVLPCLKVLHEEEASPRRIPRQQRTPIRCDSVDVDSPPEFAEESSEFSRPTAPLSPAESRAAVTPAAPHVRPPPPVDTHDPARPSPPPRRPPTATSSNEPPVRPPVGPHAPSTTTTTTSGAGDREPTGSDSRPNSPQLPVAAAPQGGLALKTAPQLRKISPAIRLPAIGGDVPMGADGELVAKPDDEEDEQLGTVQRTFRKFNFRDHACGEEAARIPPAGQSGGEERRLNFTCGTTPIVASSSPQIQHHETLNSSACESAVGSPQPAASSHCNGCLSKSANRQAAMLPIQPHHNAQHAMNHQCNDATNCRWLILMEPINALHINVILGAKGRIFRTDDSFAAVLGYDCTNRLFGTEIRRLIPSLKTDPELSGVQQQCCGCSTKRNGIPFSAIVVVEFDNEQNPLSFDVQIRSLASINGIITITDAGVVHQYNDNFLHELIGLDTTADENVMLITEIIPGFYESSTIASLSAAEQTGTTLAAPVVLPPRQHSQSESLAAGGPELDDDELAEDEPSSAHTRAKTEDETAGLKRFNSVPTIQVGSFYGLARHVDGILIPIRFDVTRIDGQSSPRLYAVGIGYERGMDYGFNQVDPTGADENAAGYTRQSSSSAAESDDAEMRIMKLADPDDDQSAGLEMRIHDVTLSALADESNEAVRGEYSTFYDTFQLIGNGTFGSVKLAARKDSGLLAVTKFVCKDKVLPESWVRSPVRENKMIPIEVHLLETLNHKNIVKVLDVFENDKYYQLVMEKLGCGMDLFEFIENHPQLDEKLTSYIFRQIVAAVEYLHQNFIVHRDLKDENVIIDSNFCCKLIDFGSAAYFGRNIMFSTFCGTMEYCSPEVLTGNKYLGPEQEAWSLGILLYTLVFYQNPFRTPQETVHADLEIPWKISEGLYQVISSLLTPNPNQRATINDLVHHWWVQQPMDPANYRFRDVVRNSERARVSPPLYVSDLHNHLKNASSCGNLANNSTLSLADSHSTNNVLQPQESGVVSAR